MAKTIELDLTEIKIFLRNFRSTDNPQKENFPKNGYFTFSEI